MTVSPRPSDTHVVLIPSYDPGPRVYDAVRAACRGWNPVWVIVDGSTDGSAHELQRMARQESGLRILVNPRNIGKGAALLRGLDLAAQQNFTHALTMDSDGQHPADLIPEFMAASARDPDCMILGRPVFDEHAPAVRVKGRQISNWWANLETLWAGIGDSLFGFRVYPIAPLRDVMHRSHFMRRFDFDPEAVVRLSWRGVRAINLPAPVRYFSVNEGGVSHFNYLRDNVLLTWMHTRLFFGFLAQLPRLMARRLANR